MSISRRKAVERARRKQREEAFMWIAAPIAIAAVALGVVKKKKKPRKKKIF